VLWLTDDDGAKNCSAIDAPVWLVRNKIDLAMSKAATTGTALGERMFAISATRGDGLGEFICALVEYAHEFFGETEGGLIGRARQRDLVQQAAASLRRSIAVIGKGEEFAAEDLRAAAHALGRLLGQVDVEDILDVIFREFCVGK
jgi:tRNA modification GTPase